MARVMALALSRMRGVASQAASGARVRHGDARVGMRQDRHHLPDDPTGLSARGHRVREFEHRVAIARMRRNGSHLRVGVRRAPYTARTGAGGLGDRRYGESWYSE